MKLSERFWLSFQIVLFLVWVYLCYWSWPYAWHGDKSLAKSIGELSQIITGGMVLLLLVVIITEAAENDWIGKFNNWLDKQDGDEGA